MRLRLEAGAVQRVVTGTGLITLRNEVEPALVIDDNDTSALGEGFEDTPMVVPVRGHLDSIRSDQETSQGRSLHRTRFQTAVSWQEPPLQYIQSITVWPFDCDIKFP